MPLRIPFGQGLNTARDPSQLGEGEMTQATGIYYRSGDDRAHRIGGVSTFASTGSGKKIDGVRILKFDSGGTDQLVALSDKVLYGATLSSTGTSGTFSTLQSGLGSQAKSLSAAHFNDRWYLAVGSENIVVESGGTTRSMGMRPPVDELTATVGAQSGSTLTRPSASSGDFNNAAQAYDTDEQNFAYVSRTSPGSNSGVFSWSGTSDTGSGRYLSVRWATSLSPTVGTLGAFTELPEIGLDDVGGTFDAGYTINVKMEVSEDSGATYTEFVNRDLTVEVGTVNAKVGVTDALELDGNLTFRATLTYLGGDATATLRILDIKVEKGATGADFTLDSGVYYVCTEYDETRGLESKHGAAVHVSAATFGTANHILVGLPSAAQNSNATHFRVYRTTDGGSFPSTLGEIATVPVAEATYQDVFDDSKDLQAKPVYALLRTLTQQDAASSSPLYFDFNSPPPRFAVMRVYEGSIVGLSADNPRSLYYSAAGFPESFPVINVIESFPLEDHDELLDCVSLGASLIVASTGAIMRLTGLPRVVNSVRDLSRVEQIKGAPGCVGRKALTAYSVAGEPRAAWISPVGVYITNGDTIDRISDDIDWSVFDGADKSDWALHWDERRLCLVVSTGATNDRYYLLHMAPEHRKANGEPQWTGPHYGSFNAFDSGYLASTHRLYGGHRSNGVVYVLDRSGVSTDSSEAYSGTQLPSILETGKIYGNDQTWAATDARLYHSDFGAGSTCDVAWTVGNDDETGGSFTHIETVSLAGSKGEQFDVSMRCQWAQVKITHTGGAGGAFRDIEARVTGQARSGGARVG